MSEREPGRLESWKEIAAYLQRDVRTLRRWEKEEGLPVHRHTHKSRSSVYAYPSEIDAWRVSRKVVPEPPAARPLWKIPAFALTMLLCLIMVGNGVRPVAAQQSATIQARQVWTGSDVDNEASITPDGHWMALTDWSTGDLAVRDMSKGQIKRLLAKTGSWDKSNDFGQSPVLSPDLRQLAYAWYDDASRSYQLRVTPNEPGGKPRVLVNSPEFVYFEPAAWSRDGKSVLSVMWKADRTGLLAWVSASDGGIRLLKSLGWRDAISPSLSPDGRFIAYSVLDSPDSETNAMYILAADGSSESELMKGVNLNESPVWTPDGGRIFFISNRSGSFGLWSIPVAAGKATGSAVRVKSDTGKLAPKGFTQSGSYLYVHREGGADIYAVDFDPISGRVRGSGALITETAVGSNEKAAWSPDGKFVAFQRARGPSEGFQLVVRSLETGKEKVYSIGRSVAQRAMWFPDGQSILQPAYNGQGKAELFKLDLKTGESKPIVPLELTGSPASALDPAGRTVYLQSHEEGIVAIDLATGRQRTLFTAPANTMVASATIALSPDGRSLAFVMNANRVRVDDRLCLVGVDGQGFRELYKPEVGQQIGGNRGVAWTRDGRSILFTAPKNNDRQLMRISIQGGEPEFTGLQAKQIRHIDVSADGSRIAFGKDEGGSAEFWALDNLLSVAK